MSTEDSRKRFEAEISSPPYELDVKRFPDDARVTAWPGNYRDMRVDLAWNIWQACEADADAKLTRALELLMEASVTLQLVGCVSLGCEIDAFLKEVSGE